jgi:hypothetical protein
MAESITDQFRVVMKEWVDLKQQLAGARKDMKVLNTREKQLKEYIKNYMKKQAIDKVNLKGGKVTLKVSQKTGSFTKAAVQNGLNIYFQGDEVRTEAAFTCILDNIEKKDSEIISLTGLKKQASE